MKTMLESTTHRRLRKHALDSLAFPDGISEGVWMLFVRDCRLWPTSITHLFLRHLFDKFALVHAKEGTKLAAVRVFHQSCDRHLSLSPSQYGKGCLRLERQGDSCAHPSSLLRGTLLFRVKQVLASAGVPSSLLEEEWEEITERAGGVSIRVTLDVFRAWWADFDARMEAKEPYRYASDGEKLTSETDRPFLTLSLGGFTSALKELAIKVRVAWVTSCATKTRGDLYDFVQVYPPGGRCECSSCRRNFIPGTTSNYGAVMSVGTLLFCSSSCSFPM